MTMPAAAEAEREARPSVRVEMVPPVGLDDLWPLVEPMLEKALAAGYGEETLSDVQERLAGRQYQLWLVLVDADLAGAVVTSMVGTPRQKACRIVYCAGEGINDWMRSLDQTVCDWARQWECDVVQVYGRHGWQKVMKAVGAKRVATVYQKEVR